MKKTYACPIAAPAGQVVRQTESGAVPGSELAQPLTKFRMT